MIQLDSSCCAYYSVPLVCPSGHDLLRVCATDTLRTDSGREYPVIDSVPVLLASPEERGRVLRAARAKNDMRETPTPDTDPLTFYNSLWAADQYGEFHPEHDALLREVVQRYRVSGPSLEIGCGKGFMRSAAPRYIALDYSLARLLGSFDPDQPRVVASAEALPFPDRSIPFVFSFYALEHVPRPEKAFEEIDRVLAPGGIALLLPCWNCTQDACDGIPVRPYRELTITQCLRKLTLGWRQSRPWKGLTLVPVRAWRYESWLATRQPTRLRFRKLRANYQTYWMPDSDACSSVDSFDAFLFYLSRGYEIVQPRGGLLRRLTFGGHAVIARKPARGEAESGRETI